MAKNGFPSKCQKRRLRRNASRSACSKRPMLLTSNRPIPFLSTLKSELMLRLVMKPSDKKSLRNLKFRRLSN